MDRETGRVWEKSPYPFNSINWFDALAWCYNLEVVGVGPNCATRKIKGWRLPTVEELASLLNPGAVPSLPAGSPFTGIWSDRYWSPTTVAGTPSPSTCVGPNCAWAVDFGTVMSGTNGRVFTYGKPNTFFVWCVRGGQGIDGVQYL